MPQLQVVGPVRVVGVQVVQCGSEDGVAEEAKADKEARTLDNGVRRGSP